MKPIGVICALLVCVVLFMGIVDFPQFGDPRQPASVNVVVVRYLEKTLEETAVPNAVTSILADYRGYDTNFETTVIFTAGVSVLMILGGLKRARKVG